MQRIYNQFSPGVQQDDFLTNGAGFIEHKNINGLRDGYGVTLGPKVNKSVLTTSAIRAIDATQTSPQDTDRMIYAGDDGKIYNASSDTPIYTFTASPVYVVAIAKLSNYYYFFYKTNFTFANISVARELVGRVEDGSFSSMDETYKPSGTFTNTGCPPIFELNNKLYIGDNSSIKTMDSAGTVVSFGFPDSNVVGMTKHNSVISIYCNTGNTYLWDGIDTTYLGTSYLGARISSVGQKAGIDYITTEGGEFYIGGGLQYQRVTRPKLSNRMEDNSSFDKRLSFNNDEGNQNNIIKAAGDDIYMYSSDTIKGLYKYGKLIPGMGDGLHKIVTQNHLGTQIDYIYDIYYYERARRLYFSYKADTTYGVDYIDLDSLETCTDGYMVTEIFSGGTSFKKELARIRRATSNTSGSNYINVYYRVNNGDWVLIRNINDTLDVIERENAHNEADKSPFSQFVDIQLKIELHNDDGGENAPTLHELMLEYEAIET